jgi:hypothetical protein
MEGESSDSGRTITTSGYKTENRNEILESLAKAEVYESLELLLSDKELRKWLCSRELGVYRDLLWAWLKRLLRPITGEEVDSIINTLIQLGVFKVEWRKPPPFVLPKELLVKKKKAKKGKVVETLEPPKGFEIEGVYGDVVVLRVSKQFLTPSEMLKAVCREVAKG